MKLKYVIILSAVLLAGCVNGQPADTNVQLTVAEQTLSASEKLIVAANSAGLIPEDIKPQIKASVLSARALLKTAVAHNGDSTTAALMAEVNTAIQQVSTYGALFQKSQP